MLVLPYHPAECPIEKPPGYDGTYYPEGVEKTPRPFAIVKANQLMVDSGQTSYPSDEPGEYTGRNTDAISMVIDLAQM